MRKKILAVVLVCSMLLASGCSLEHGLNNAEDEGLYYLVTPILETPEGWSDSDFQCYYYQVNTHVVYFGNDDLSEKYSVLCKLESEQYRCYIYDEETNTFRGVE